MALASFERSAVELMESEEPWSRAAVFTEGGSKCPNLPPPPVPSKITSLLVFSFPSLPHFHRERFRLSLRLSSRLHLEKQNTFDTCFHVWIKKSPGWGMKCSRARVYNVVYAMHLLFLNVCNICLI